MRSPTIAELNTQLSMDGILRFRDLADCTYKVDGEMLKLFVPKSGQILGGRPDDRRLDGYIGFELQAEVSATGRQVASR